MKHINLFEGFSMEPTEAYSGYLDLPLNMGTPEDTQTWLEYLSKICGEHSLKIVGLLPMENGNPRLTFKGSESALRSMLTSERFADVDALMAKAKPSKN